MVDKWSLPVLKVLIIFLTALASGIVIMYVKYLAKCLMHSRCTRNGRIALAGVAQWIEHWSVNQRVTSSIPSQGTCLGCRPGPE